MLKKSRVERRLWMPYNWRFCDESARRYLEEREKINNHLCRSNDLTFAGKAGLKK